VIFTSNTTEAINLTAESLRNESEQGIESVVHSAAFGRNQKRGGPSVWHNEG
jgi:selenocysteine lyase/cysteine desulfurase